MGFSKEIRKKALKLSARHCSICHRYKGVKMEVHHIIQEADGGANTFENAIPVCFDCHSDAGHFNDRHPKGSKFSKEEIRESRDRWYEIVRTQSIPEKLEISKHIQTSYYVLHTLEILENVMNKDFTTLNHFRERVLISPNEESTFWNELLINHEKDYKSNIDQELMIEIQQFESVEDYNSKYDNVKIIKKDDDINSYYQAVRPVSWEEVLSMNIPKNFLSVLSHTKIETSKLINSVLVYSEDSCAGETPIGFTEYLQIEPLSFIFLGITNASKEQIKLNTLNCKNKKLQLPNFNLLSKEMLLIPLSSAINLQDIDNESIRLSHIDGERGKDFSRVLKLVDYLPEKVDYLNGNIEPKNIIYNDNEGEYQIDVHKLDFNNLYSLNSYWQLGSCPHLFFININSRQYYQREIFKSHSNNIGEEIIHIPHSVKNIIIRELEDEITIIEKIVINNNVVASDLKLEKGDFLILDVKPKDIVTLTGGYKPLAFKELNSNDYWYRNYLVSKSNRHYNFNL